MCHLKCILAKWLLPALMSVVAAPSVFGTTIYDETSLGDLPGNQISPLAIGTFDPGLNVIGGHLSLSTDGGGGQGDTFSLNLLSTQTITDVRLTITNYTGAVTYATTFFQTSPSPGVLTRYVGQVGNQVIDFPAPPSLAPQPVGFSVQVAVSDGNPASGMDWKWEVSVVQVPEASSVQLICAGLAAVALVARRRCAQRP